MLRLLSIPRLQENEKRHFNEGVSLYLILVRFLSGQGIIQVVNLSVGIVLLWLLPINEYALYVIALFLFTVASIITNLGVSKAITTFGAREAEDKSYLGSLHSAGVGLTRRLFVIAIVAITFLSWIVFEGKEWSVATVVISVVLVGLTCWYQNKVNLHQAILNIRHDDKALFMAGLGGGIARLLVSGLCIFWPIAIVALIGNLIGAFIMSFLIDRGVKKYVKIVLTENREIQRSLTRFIVPLSPAIIYFAFQGQISILILSIYDYTESIAEVGALGRLGQLMALLMMLNPFFIQPYFARIKNIDQFVKSLLFVFFSFIVLSALLISSSYLVPEVWLFILGDNYSGLMHELPIAIMVSLAALVGATLYTIVISRNHTSSQYWGVIIGLSCQIAFIAFVGVQSTLDALYLNLIPAVGFFIVQAVILSRVLYSWKEG